MLVSELKKILENSPDGYEVIIQVHNNGHYIQRNSQLVETYITGCTVKHDIEENTYSHYDKKEQEYKLITSRQKLGGKIILFNSME